TLDEGADIGTISLGAVSGDEVFPVDQIVNLAVADVLPGLLGQQGEDLEFRQGEVDGPSCPDCPADIEAQGKPPQLHRRSPHRFRLAGWPAALGNQLQTLEQDWQTAGLVDEIHRTALERRLLV